MSGQNGDKARFNRMRRQKIQRRTRQQELASPSRHVEAGGRRKPKSTEKSA